MKYTKTYIKAYLAGILFGISIIGYSPEKYGLSNTLRRTNTNYIKLSPRFEATRSYYVKAKPGIMGFAILATVFRFIGDHLV